MKYFIAVFFLGVILLFQCSSVSAQANSQKVFLLENTATNQWCAFSSEEVWRAAVQDAGSMTVGTLTYSNDLLSQIDVTEEGESGDWTVYDHYFFDARGKLVKLSRMINIIPGDRSVLQLFLISDRKAKMTESTAKQLSTGKPLASPDPIWLPKLSIETSTKMFPFSNLFGRPGLRSNEKSCVREVEAPSKEG